MKAVRSGLKPNREQATGADRARQVAVSIYAAHLAGMDRPSLACEFGLTKPQLDRLLSAIPPAIRRAIESRANDPDGEVARWRGELARREAESCRVAAEIRRAIEAVLDEAVIEWKQARANRPPTPGEQVYRRRVEGQDFDRIASEMGITRRHAVYLVTRLKPRQRQRIEREVREARKAAERG